MGVCGSTNKSTTSGNNTTKTSSAPVDKDYPPHGLAECCRGLDNKYKLGCGDADYHNEELGMTSNAHVLPDAQPDWSSYDNFITDVFKADPTVWDCLKDKKTSLGVGLAECIKTGLDVKCNPKEKAIGLVGGDEESWTLFKELVDPLMLNRSKWPADAIQPTNLNLADLDTTRVDPDGKYALSVRVRTGRNIRGWRLSPTISFEDRRKLEELLTNGLLSLKGDLAGDYHPLHGSRSYGKKKGGMSLERSEQLRAAGNLFQEPDSMLLCTSGGARHWPDARGIFHNKEENFFVWVNEEDHLRIVSMALGDDVQGVMSRLLNGIEGVSNTFKAKGFSFMHNDHLGFISTCPSNLGTALRASIMMRLPLFSAGPLFKDVVHHMGLAPRGRHGENSEADEGVWDISNSLRIGKGEIELVNLMIRGCAKMVLWEKALEAGENIDEEVEAVMAEEW